MIIKTSYLIGIVRRCRFSKPFLRGPVAGHVPFANGLYQWVHVWCRFQTQQGLVGLVHDLCQRSYLPGGGNWGEIRKILQQTPGRRPAIAVPLWKLWRKSVQTVRYQQQRTRMNPVSLGNQNQTNKSPSSRALCTTRKRAKHSISMSTPRPWVAICIVSSTVAARYAGNGSRSTGHALKWNSSFSRRRCKGIPDI